MNRNTKANKLHFLFLVLILCFFILGTLEARADNGNKTFAITDKHPYPGKFNLTIGNHPVSTEFSIYIYIVNNGGHFNPDDKKASAEDITVTLYSETGAVLFTKTASDISVGTGYVAVPIVWPANVYVTLKVTGVINDNGVATTVESNYFWIGDPVSTPQTGVGQILWEKEVL